MKKLLLIALVAAGFLVAGTSTSEARVFFNIGFGLPFYPYPAYYPAYPPYYGCGYPYAYGYAYPSFYYGQRIYFSTGRPFFWYRGHRVFLRHR
jgi:hypothetical protein